MSFPTIPTVAAGRVLSTLATSPSGTHTSPNLSSLTKNSGDLLIAIVIIYDGNSTNAEFSAWGGGFTEFADFAGTATMGIGCAYKWSTGSETGTFTVTSADASTNDSAFFLLAIPGAHGSTAPEGGSFVTGTSAAADPGSFNPAGWNVEDTLWIAVGGSGETSTSGTYTGIASAPANYSDYADSGISADVVGGVEGAVAFRQLAAASDDVGTFSVDTSNARNSALVIAVRPPVATNAAAENALGTGSADGSAASLAPNVGEVAGTGTAAAAIASVEPSAGLTSGSGTAYAATVKGDAAAQQATGTGEALVATIVIEVPAGLTTGTGASSDATVDTSTGTNANAEIATGIGITFDIAPAFGIAGGQAAGAVSVADVALGIAVSVTSATASGVADDAVAITTVAAAADLALGSGAVADSSIVLTSNAGSAAGGGVALDATVATSTAGMANAAVATGLGAVLVSTRIVAVGSGFALGIGNASQEQAKHTRRQRPRSILHASKTRSTISVR